MVLRLVLDAAWRTRQAYFLILPIIALLWTVAAHDHASVSWALMISIMMAYAFGPAFSVATMRLRELRALPVTSRDLWVATWVISTVVIAIALTAAQTLAVIGVMATTGSSAVSAETLLLASLYCFAWAGAFSPLMPALGYSLNNIGSRRPRWLWIMLSVACGLMFLGGFGLPYYFAKFLPLALNQFSWTAASALIVCLALTVISFKWTPQRGGAMPARAAGRPAASASATKTRLRFVDQLTGIPRVAWPFAFVILASAAATLVAFIGYWAAFESGISLRTFLQNNAILLFDTGFLPDPDMGGRMWIVLLLASILTSSPWKAFGRMLKVLPLTTGQVNALLLATPFAQWALVWVALIAIHVAVTGTLPLTVRPEVFVFLGGVSALGQGLMIRHGRMGTIWIPLLVGGFSSIAARVVSRQPVPVEVVLLAAGLAGFAVAAFVNHRTLTRSTSSSKAYRQEMLPFGFSAPGAPR